MIPSLPNFTNPEAFRSFRADSSRWLPVVVDIARSHGLACTSPQIFSTGTNLVVGLDEPLILKIFPPVRRGQFNSERRSLALLHGRLGVPIPEIVCEGERDQWPYLVITRVYGRLGAEVWPALPEDQKERVLFEVGEIIAEVQRVPAAALLGIEPRWDAFLRRQIEGCRMRHVRLGLPRKFLDGLDDLLRDAAELIPLNRKGDGWHLAGLIDFGDVQTGWGEYDLLGPSAFMAAGRPGRVRSLFGGFGYSPADVNFALKRRLMALMLLHRASDPVRHICIEGWQQKADDLIQLQELIWPD